LYQPEYNRQQVELAKARGLEVITEGNIYQILHSCKKVIGISSSTLYEAELMKKEVVFLNEKDYIRRGKMVRWESINEEFWKKVRSQVCECC
jgi:spore coat polysaccharide biosynthesis predicted glycosyltransferase SpsG